MIHRTSSYIILQPFLAQVQHFISHDFLPLKKRKPCAAEAADAAAAEAAAAEAFHTGKCGRKTGLGRIAGADLDATEQHLTEAVLGP